MTLLDYIADMERRRALAESLGTSPDYLWQVATGWRGRRASVELAVRIQEATAGAVTVAELRPDLAAALEAAGYRRDPEPQEETRDAA